MNWVNFRSDHGHEDSTVNIVVDYYYYYYKPKSCLACGVGSDRKLRSNITLRSVLRRTGKSGSIESGAPLPHARGAGLFVWRTQPM